MKPWILGLTGGIGSGKSAAAAHFASLGVHTVDADHAARWVVEPGRPALASIVERFGESMLQADGTLNRACVCVSGRRPNHASPRPVTSDVGHPRGESRRSECTKLDLRCSFRSPFG